MRLFSRRRSSPEVDKPPSGRQAHDEPEERGAEDGGESEIRPAVGSVRRHLERKRAELPATTLHVALHVLEPVDGRRPFAPLREHRTRAEQPSTQ